MKKIHCVLLFIIGITTHQGYGETQNTDVHQAIIQSKEQIKWDCARLIYLLVRDALSKIQDKLIYTTLHQQVQWVFSSVAMQEVVEMSALLASKAELCIMAASIARQNIDEDAMLVLQIESEYARRGWFARYATLLMYGFGALCGYAGAYYLPFNKQLLDHINIG